MDKTPKIIKNTVKWVWKTQKCGFQKQNRHIRCIFAFIFKHLFFLCDVQSTESCKMPHSCYSIHKQFQLWNIQTGSTLTSVWNQSVWGNSMCDLNEEYDSWLHQLCKTIWLHRNLMKMKRIVHLHFHAVRSYCIYLYIHLKEWLNR